MKSHDSTLLWTKLTLKECSFHEFASLTNLDQNNIVDVMTKTIHCHRGTLNKLERYLIILVLVGDFCDWTFIRPMGTFLS